MSQARYLESDRDVQPSRKIPPKKKSAAHSPSRKGQGTGITQTQQHQQVPASSNPTTIRSSTVIRRVQAVVHVKREEDVKESDAVVDLPSSASAPAATSGKTGSVSRRRLVSRKGAAVFSDDEDGSAEEEVHERKGASESKSGSGIVYNLRNPSKINYQEDNDEDEEEDELMMGAEVRLLSPNNFRCVTRYFAYARKTMTKFMGRTLSTSQDNVHDQGKNADIRCDE